MLPEVEIGCQMSLRGAATSGGSTGCGSHQMSRMVSQYGFPFPSLRAFGSLPGLVNVAYRIGDGDWTNVEGDAPVKVKMPRYGKHTIEVRAEDLAGNVATGSTTFTIEEKEAPGPSIVLAMVALSLALVVVRRRRD
jgi:hypothetical protein